MLIKWMGQPFGLSLQICGGGLNGSAGAGQVLNLLSGVKRTLASPKSNHGTLWNVGSDHSGLMLANLITFAHFSTSAVMKV